MTSVYYRRQDYLRRWTRGQRPGWHVGMMAPTFFLIGDFRQKEKFNFLKNKNKMVLEVFNRQM
jgi:hypothetical protein